MQNIENMMSQIMFPIQHKEHVCKFCIIFFTLLLCIILMGFHEFRFIYRLRMILSCWYVTLHNLSYAYYNIRMEHIHKHGSQKFILVSNIWKLVAFITLSWSILLEKKRKKNEKVFFWLSIKVYETDKIQWHRVKTHIYFAK